jgi:asparagine synthase (glutamine-hydrolysing)
VTPGRAAAMGAAVAHRGPDGDGVYERGPIGLGHRRLAIIDLSDAASQPMRNEAGDLWLVLNGEIYNYRELRQELERAGHRFVSQSDTEVVLHAFEEWGEACLDRFNGMFAFAVWEEQRKSLFIARDRYGIKPLYYTFAGSTFLFGSEQKALLVHPGVKREIDMEALFEYFAFQNLFTDRTLLKGVRILPAACWARISVGDPASELRVVRYWDFAFEEPESCATEDEYLEELDRLFRQAVRRQLVSDVDVGSYLSGGMDSGSITAIAATELPYLNTFTCGFDLRTATGLELSFDERANAEYMSYVFKTEHYEMVLKGGDMERVLPTLAWHLEEPRVGQSYPNYYAAKLASRFVKVCLSGAGGDELFGGYPWRYYRAVGSTDFEHYVDNYYSFWQRLLPNDAARRVFAPVWSDVSHVSTRDIFRDVFRYHPRRVESPEDCVNLSLYFEAKTFLHGLLVVDDKLSMAHGLETRVPFLDNDLVDFAMRLPVRHKLRHLTDVVPLDENEPGPKSANYYSRTRDGKLLLRKAMERYIPAEVANAEKQGFSAPDASWFRGDSIDYVRRTLYEGSPRIYDLLDREALQHLVDEHLQGKRNHRLLVWSLLNLEWWLRQYLT